jgi:sucrose-phosphate synthase
MNEDDIDKKFKINHRIHMEEEILKHADLIVSSTHHEIKEQYAQYENNNIPKFSVIPPGLDIETFYPFYRDILSDTEKDEARRYAHASLLEELNRFLMKPDRPLILSLCRPDTRKNISGLITAYGEDLALQSMANLAVFAGIRKDISKMEDNERNVLTEILLLMDKYDLYGKIAIPKKHDFEYEVPELYRIAAEKRGVFVNSALAEPFGITLIESAACGLPIIAPNDGGPKDIINNCKCGLLVDTRDVKGLAEAIKQIISDSNKWKQYSKAGILNIRKFYTWKTHSETYVDEIKQTLESLDPKKMKVAEPSDAIGKRLAGLNHFIISDIDNTLIGEENDRLEEFLDILSKYRKTIGFGVASGRTVDSVRAYLEKYGVHPPDIIISSVGAEIYYGKNIHYAKGWATHISAQWDREKIVSTLKQLPFLTYQEESTQRQFKVSYNMLPGKDRLATIHERLLRNKCRYTLIYSHDKYIDILPYRASKGKALRYLSYKWEIPLNNFLVCGDSGNDEEMLRGDPLAVVVGNYSSELERLKGQRNIYFAKKKYAGGILEAIQHYKFLEKAEQEVD